MTCGPVFTSGPGTSLSGPNKIDHLGHVTARQSLALAGRQGTRIDDDAALRAAHRDADDRALVGHPERKRFDFVDGHVLMEADAALGRTAHHVVLHAKRTEVADRAVVHAHRQQDLGRAPRQLDHRNLIVGELEAARGRVELVERVLERRRVPFLERSRDLPTAHRRFALLPAPLRGPAAALRHASHQVRFSAVAARCASKAAAPSTLADRSSSLLRR